MRRRSTTEKPSIEIPERQNLPCGRRPIRRSLAIATPRGGGRDILFGMAIAGEAANVINIYIFSAVREL
jgi:hypothetical protein